MRKIEKYPFSVSIGTQSEDPYGQGRKKGKYAEGDDNIQCAFIKIVWDSICCPPIAVLASVEIKTGARIIGDEVVACYFEAEIDD